LGNLLRISFCPCQSPRGDGPDPEEKNNAHRDKLTFVTKLDCIRESRTGPPLLPWHTDDACVCVGSDIGRRRHTPPPPPHPVESARMRRDHLPRTADRTYPLPFFWEERQFCRSDERRARAETLLNERARQLRGRRHVMTRGSMGQSTDGRRRSPFRTS
jgi:hypothetical protein